MSKSPLTRRSFLERNVMASAGAGLAGVAMQAAPQGAIIPTQLEPGQKLRVGILGCGNRSRAHIAAVNHYAERMEITALCDILPEMLEEKRQLVKAGQPTIYKDYEEMLKDDDLDAVIIVLPNTLHREGAVAALDAGKHVLCEKPLSIDVDDTRQIIAASDRSRRVLQVGTQSRHSPGYQELASKIHDGLIGNVLYGWNQTFRADWRKIYPDPEEDSRLNWRMKQAEGGSVVYEMGIHLIDVFNWFINSDVEEVSCLGGTHNKRLQKRDSWDHAGLVVRYTNGALMTYGGNLYSCGGPGPNILFGDGGTLELGGRDDDKAILRKRPYWRPHNTVESPSGGSEDVTLPKSELDTTFLQYEYFLESVQGKKPVFPSARDHLAAVQIARGSLMSAAEHRHVKASEIP
jgi:UDP-N-acetyl-2-amino-2-deoxyglucuronate dehydrogenase